MKSVNYEWMTWSFGCAVDGDLSPEVRARIDADRHRVGGLSVVLQTLAIPWIQDRSLSKRFIDAPCRLNDESRRWARLTSNGRDVYIEEISGHGRGPRWGFVDVRIHLDGELRGRALSAGSTLGCGCNFGPAVAMLRSDLAIRIDSRREKLEVLRSTTHQD